MGVQLVYAVRLLHRPEPFRAATESLQRLLHKFNDRGVIRKNNRPFDMAVSDYFQGNNLFRKKVQGG